MNMSVKKRQRLYEAIHSQVMKLRVRLEMNRPDPETLDQMLRELSEGIWERQREVLKIKD